MKTFNIYCGGEFITSTSPLEVKNPFDGSVVATTFQADEKILEQAIQKALAVKQQLKELPSYAKYEALLYISNKLKENKKFHAELLSAESAKPMRYALAEIDRSIQTFLIAAEESKRLPKEYMSLDWTVAGKQKEGIVNYFPIGLVAGIAPFNFPLNLAVHKLAPAIATGCPIILKPASSTPLSTLSLAQIIDETELPKGALSILPMNRKTGNLLVTDERFNLLSFTGSPVVGWEMKKQAGKKKVVLELGGNAGVIISDTKNLDDVVTKSMIGAFSYSGQICIHAQRFVVHEKLFDAFLTELKKQTLLLKNENPHAEGTVISSMIDEENALRVEQWVQEALSQGAELICGGKRTGTYVEPTILIKCTDTMKVYAEEVFGPVICVEKYSGDIKEAVDAINNSKFGLQCGVFTDSVAELDYCFKHIEVGGVIHNQMPTIRFDQMPYGGIKESGLGREGIRYAMMDMLEPKILVK
ncbi:MAG: Aldehyde Dehydrogenase [Bacteroidetes bacterium]|jgi:glyceraldehyde-3-phosphate dehydrogenase (NADP+)|nr:Aldehyde Dehydrogenase [Bacteroidota bacterium]